MGLFSSSPSEKYLNQKRIEFQQTRKEELNIIRNNAFKQTRSYYPFEVKAQRKLTKLVELYIIHRAIHGLPKSQFQDTKDLRNPRDWVEIGGILGYNKKLYEISYLSSNRSNVRITRLRNATRVSSRLRSSIDLNKLIKYDTIIHWHSHPSNSGSPSIEDIYNSINLTNLLPERINYFDIIYSPAINQCIWYQLKKRSRLNPFS